MRSTQIIAPKNGIDLGTTSGVLEIDASKANAWELVANGNVTLDITNLPPGQSLSVMFTQDGVGGRTCGFSGMTIESADVTLLTPDATAGIATIWEFQGVSQTSGAGVCRLVSPTKPGSGGGGGGGGAPIHFFAADPVVLVVGGTNVLGPAVAGPVTLPAGVTLGDEVVVALDGNSNDITINRSGGDTINGAATYIMYGSANSYAQTGLELIQPTVWGSIGAIPQLPAYVAPGAARVLISHTAAVGAPNAGDGWATQAAGGANDGSSFTMTMGEGGDATHHAGSYNFLMGLEKTDLSAGSINIQGQTVGPVTTDRWILTPKDAGLELVFPGGVWQFAETSFGGNGATRMVQLGTFLFGGPAFFINATAIQWNGGVQITGGLTVNMSGAGLASNLIINANQTTESDSAVHAFVERRRGRITTTDATPTSDALFTFSDAAYIVTTFVARCTAGASLGDVVKMVRTTTTANHAEVLSQVGATNSNGTTDEGVSGTLNADIVIVNPSATQVVTGKAGETWLWQITTDIYPMPGA